MWIQEMVVYWEYQVLDTGVLPDLLSMSVVQPAAVICSCCAAICCFTVLSVVQWNE